MTTLEELEDLKQSGSVDEYITQFEYVSSQVGRLPEEQYLGYLVLIFKPRSHEACL